MTDLPVTPALEEIPDGEPDRIEATVDLTLRRLLARYDGRAIRRGVHPKDHGCVTATFTVADPLPETLRVGVFTTPGQVFDAFIRFSNADVDPEKADSAVEDDGVAHGSRGMAVKVLGVTGEPLVTSNLTTKYGPLNQDFLMVNQPVFAFANVEDYEALSQILLDHADDPSGFFARLGDPDPAISGRARVTGAIVKRIAAAAFQPAPASPLDNSYFGAAPFLFGEGRAMRFRARPVAPDADAAADFADPGYLRAGLRRRLSAAAGQDIVFEFQVQVRDAASLSTALPDLIENACNDWPDIPFETVARIAIPPQDADPDTPERRALCENLIFSPWNGLAAHRPLGGINRLRRLVYEISARIRKPSGTCPFSAPTPTG
ncbi:MAG: hypothetical protein KDK29_01315 [Sedimentitalea sp.]|nr:hypothetical protein [Sedimentitalea sp.]